MNMVNIMNKLRVALISCLITLTVCVPVTHADEREDLTILRNTVVNLLQALVEQGVMSQQQAQALVQQAQQNAEREIAEIKASEVVPDDVVRVPYVPEIVKDEIRNQVRDQLRAEVVADVVSHAKRERWGVKEALPSWLSRIKMSGDARVRGQGEFYNSSNAAVSSANPYLDIAALNASGFNGIGNSVADGTDEFLNTTQDRYRERVRLRLNIDAKINEQFSTGIRLTTGNTNNPVSTNQTVGNSANPYDLVIDKLFINYQGNQAGSLAWLSATGGRMHTPWFGSDLLFDDDLSFEGLAATAKFEFGGSGLYAMEHSNKAIFATLGAFPIEEYGKLSSRDKWMFGGQLGASMKFDNQSQFKLAASYYNYTNVQSRLSDNTFDARIQESSDFFNASKPAALQKGNTMGVIYNPADAVTGITSDTEAAYALASDFDILNLTAQYGLTMFAPYHLTLTADYVKNLGYDSSQVEQRVGSDVVKGDEGYHFRVDYGWPRISHFGHWNVFAAYKHIERDAVMDAFVDSDFHLGGTDAKGWELGANLGLAKNTWLSMTYRSTDEIDGPANGNDNCNDDSSDINCNLSIDILQIDLNTRY